MPELKRLSATRIGAAPAALDAAQWPDEALVMRFAPDEAMITPAVETPVVDDPHAIVIAEGGFVGVWIEAETALDFLERHCEWELPFDRPAFAQGAVAGIPAKLWLETERVLFVVPAPYAADFEERLA